MNTAADVVAAAPAVADSVVVADDVTALQVFLTNCLLFLNKFLFFQLPVTFVFFCFCSFD